MSTPEAAQNLCTIRSTPWPEKRRMQVRCVRWFYTNCSLVGIGANHKLDKAAMGSRKGISIFFLEHYL